MTFVCGPDQAFSERAKGPSAVDWRARFSQYKCIVLRLQPAHRSRLLAWYDERIFLRPTISAIQTNPGPSEPRFDEIEDLIQRLGDADVDTPSAPLSFAPPSSQSPASPPTEGDATMSERRTEPDVPDAPSTGAAEVEDETVATSRGAKKATRAPRARRVQSRKKGGNLG
jgi:hypothetical protein